MGIDAIALARAGLLVLLGGGVSACGPSLDMAGIHAEDAATGVFIDFDRMGDVVLCGQNGPSFAHWTGNAFEAKSRLGTSAPVLFQLDHDYLVVNGQRTMRVEVDEILDTAEEPSFRLRITRDGDALEIRENGKRVAVVSPIPERPRMTLVAFAAVENAARLAGCKKAP
jgi:hypothetical protein